MSSTRIPPHCAWMAARFELRRTTGVSCIAIWPMKNAATTRIFLTLTPKRLDVGYDMNAGTLAAWRSQGVGDSRNIRRSTDGTPKVSAQELKRLVRLEPTWHPLRRERTNDRAW
jgi:hypothetical protein